MFLPGGTSSSPIFVDRSPSLDTRENMSTIDRVAPEHRGLAKGISLFEPSPEGLKAFRTGIVEGLTALVSPEPSNAETVIVPANGDRPDVRTLVHRPTTATGDAPAIVYLHPGGLIAGTPDMMAGASEKIARQTGALVLAPDYRLAPEATFLAALEDAYSALLWLESNATELGIDPTRISVMGESAGGSLAAGLSMLSRDRGVVSLRSQILLYPTLDIRTGTEDAPSDDPLTGEFIWGRPQNRSAWQMAKGQVSIDDERIGYLSPALAKDLSGLPPAFITAGSLDLSRDENITYAQRLMRAGVPTELVVYAGAIHLFDALPGDLGDRARNDVVAAVKRLA
jgi:acetyl esterase/lipase